MSRIMFDVKVERGNEIDQLFNHWPCLSFGIWTLKFKRRAFPCHKLFNLD